ncbi:MAG: hypothetical protein JSS66_11050 [Armatimonadetes bacterium]|nr:hypothetical protein [Armatimonadota bacterium]
MDYQRWLKELEKILLQSRPDLRIMDIDPNVMHQAFQDGESPVIFARRSPIPLRPSASPTPPQPGYRAPHQRQLMPAQQRSNKSNVVLIVAAVVALPIFFCCSGLFFAMFNPSNRGARDTSPKVETPRSPAPANIQSSPATSGTPNQGSGSTTLSDYRQRFETVADAFRQQGASVDAFDPQFPYTMRIYLPSRVAMDMTDNQARELAGLTRTKLDDKAIVYLKSEGGQTLAKAAPWGIEGR